MADVSTGLYAALSIMALLCGKERGRVQGPTSAAVSLFDTMTELMGYSLTYTRHTGVDQEPKGMGSPAVAPYGAYPTADGHTVVLGTTNDGEWQRLARELIGRPDLADDERLRSNSGRVAHSEALDAEIGTWCARHDLAYVQDRADAAGIGNSRYNTPSDVVAHPHLTARDRWREIDTPGGPVPSAAAAACHLRLRTADGADPGPRRTHRGRPRRTGDRRRGGVAVSEEPVLLCGDSGGVRTLTLNRPHRRNAIDEELWRALRDALTDAGNDRSVRALVLTGAGGAFCSGADISGDSAPRTPCTGCAP
ncbi:CoA transferase [Streptomyces sp. S1D4-11]